MVSRTRHAARVLEALQKELVSCLTLLPAGRRGTEREHGQREALQHIVVFLRDALTPSVKEPPCPPQG
jgi:hypothetical protein